MHYFEVRGAPTVGLLLQVTFFYVRGRSPSRETKLRIFGSLYVSFMRLSSLTVRPSEFRGSRASLLLPDIFSWNLLLLLLTIFAIHLIFPSLPPLLLILLPHYLCNSINLSFNSFTYSFSLIFLCAIYIFYYLLFFSFCIFLPPYTLFHIS